MEKIDTFDDMKITITNSDDKKYSGEKTDYSKLVFTEGSPYMADCIGVKRAEKPVWKNPEKMQTVFRFLFRLLDDYGESAVLSKDCTPMVTYGSMRSNLYKVLKALYPNASEQELKESDLVKARLADISVAEGREICIPCIIVVKKTESGYLKVDSVLSEPTKKQPAKQQKQLNIEKTTIDNDEIPFA